MEHSDGSKWKKGCKSLEIFVDHSAVEIFINNGEYVMTSRIFPNPNEHLIRMRGKDISLTIWQAEKTVEEISRSEPKEKEISPFFILKI
jgi:sucrose-6-phosphate hydrolase SacC (GH32 family)